MKKQGYWSVELKIMINGEEATIEDLSEETKAEIAEKIIDGYKGGEINEETED
jgi:hypothetical protein